jgi:hypothetical protein
MDFYHIKCAYLVFLMISEGILWRYLGDLWIFNTFYVFLVFFRGLLIKLMNFHRFLMLLMTIFNDFSQILWIFTIFNLII